MINSLFICEKCEKETMIVFDEKISSVVEFNFKTKIIRFICPHCDFINILDFGKIKEALERKTSLPKITGSRY